MLKGLEALFRTQSREELADPRRAKRKQADFETAMEPGLQLAPHREPESDAVEVVPQPPLVEGTRVRVRYRGPLSKERPAQLFLHCGYGPGPWRDVADVPMVPEPDGAWSATVPIRGSGQFSFCFRDDQSRWDNNAGRDWRCAIESTPAVR